MAGKLAGRGVPLAQLGLAKNPAGPVFLLDLANGHDRALLELFCGQIDQVLAGDVRCIVLGDVPAHLPAAVALKTAARKHPARFAFVASPDERLRHGALAAADFQLHLGRDLHSTEALLRGLKYGTLPIAPASVGLKQIVEDHRPGSVTGCGLVFYHRTGEALFDVLTQRAPALLESPERWESLRQRAMVHAGKFTWARTAAEYVALYGRLLQ